MKFFQKEICEKLIKLGLKSESDFGYSLGSSGPYEKGCFNAEAWNASVVPAFTLLDFLSTEEYAKENCRILFSEEPSHEVNFDRSGRSFDVIFNWQYQRYAIIDSPDGIEYVSKFLEGRAI